MRTRLPPPAAAPDHRLEPAQQVEELHRAVQELEQTLHETRDLFTTYMDNSPAVAWMKDDQGRYVYTNKTWERRFELTREQWKGRTDFEIWPQETARNLRANDEAVLASGTVQELFEDVPLPDGSMRHWLVFKFPVVNARGERFVGGMALDVTDQRRAQAALLHSEERTRLIINTALDAVIQMDVRGRVTEWNPQAETIFGWSRADAIDRELAELIIPPEMRPAHYAGLTAFLQSGHGPLLNRRVEITALHRDGRRFPVELSVSPTVIDGEVSFSGFLRDITEEKRSVEALRLSQQSYESLINTIDGIVWEADPVTCRFSFVSKKAERLLGYSLEQWLSSPKFWVDHIHPDDRESAVRFCREATAERRDHELEYRMVAADGRTVWLHDMVTVIVEHGKPTKIRGVMVDVTDRKAAEEARRRSEMLLADSQAMAHLGSFEWEMAADRVTWSDELFRIFGVEPQKFEPTLEGFLSRVHPDDRARVRRTIEHSCREARPFQQEERIVRPDGSVRVLATQGEVITDRLGNPLRLIGTCQDVTERKRAEEELRRSNERHQLLLSELDHRVRNNLASLAALVDLSSQGKRDVREFASSIRGRIQAISSVHDLLSRGQWKSIRLSDLILWLTPRERHSALDCSGPEVRISPHHLTSLGVVLHELATNSLKYGALSLDGGRVEVTWTLQAPLEDRACQLELNWRDVGGPAIHAPPSPGVGTELILGLTRSELSGEAQLTYPPGGACHRFTFSLRDED